VELSLTELGQTADELKVGVAPLVAWALNDGALGDGHDLAQFVPRCGQEQARPGGSLRVEGVRRRAEAFEHRPPDAAVFLGFAEKQAKFGVSVPDVMILGLAFQEFLPSGAGLLGASSRGQCPR